jgi:hypothetical protein
MTDDNDLHFDFNTHGVTTAKRSQALARRKGRMAGAERDAEEMRLRRVEQQCEMQKAAQATAPRQQTLVARAICTPRPGGPAPEQLQKLLALKNALSDRGTADEWTALITPFGVQKASELTSEQAVAVIATARVALDGKMASDHHNA